MRLTNYIAIVTVILLLFISGVFILGKERSHKIPPSEFMTIFANKRYEKLIDKICSFQHVIVVGKDADGVDVFVGYTLNQTLGEEHNVN
jgi:hypothetical protein